MLSPCGNVMDMAIRTVTESAVSDGKKKPGRKRAPQGRSPNYLLYVRIDPELGDWLEQYMGKLDPQPTTTAMIEHILRRFRKMVEEPD